MMGAVLATVVAAFGGGCEEQENASGGPVETAAPVSKLDSSLARHLPPGTDFQQAVRGHELFPVCAVCHGLEGEGTQLGPSLRDPEWIHGSGELDDLVQVIRTGVADPREHPIPMPEMGGGRFTDEDLRALAVYVYALSRSGAAPE